MTIAILAPAPLGRSRGSSSAVEHLLAKEGVESSNLFFRSTHLQRVRPGDRARFCSLTHNRAAVLDRAEQPRNLGHPEEPGNLVRVLIGKETQQGCAVARQLNIVERVEGTQLLPGPGWAARYAHQRLV